MIAWADRKCNAAAEAEAPSTGPKDDPFVCEHCGQTIGDPMYSGPAGHSIEIGCRCYRTCEICVECFFDAHIPKGYVRREAYVGGVATERPPLGIDWLDERVWGRVEMLFIYPRRERHWGL